MEKLWCFFLLVTMFALPMVYCQDIAVSPIVKTENKNNSRVRQSGKCVNGKYFVYSGYYGGRLGNQLFQIAAALSLAMDNDAEAVFPDYPKWELYEIPVNREKVFHRINFEMPQKRVMYTYFEHKDFHFRPIPYFPNMKIFGYFQSENFFKHNKEKVLPYFEASQEISDYIVSKYHDLLSHPCTVAVHLRGYLQESPNLEKMFVMLGRDYVEKAASLFEEEALFVIFSDQMDWAKEVLKDFSRPHIFIEGERHYHDFYLMSYMKHQIITNSTFGWWSAYLNKNPDKIVAAPYPWFHPNHHLSSEYIIPDDWVKIFVEVK